MAARSTSRRRLGLFFSRLPGCQRGSELRMSAGSYWPGRRVSAETPRSAVGPARRIGRCLRPSRGGQGRAVVHAVKRSRNVQFAGRGGRLAVSAGSGPLQVPGAHELPEQHQLAGVLTGRPGNVQGVDEPVIRPGGLRRDRHHSSSCYAAGKPPARRVRAYRGENRHRAGKGGCSGIDLVPAAEADGLEVAHPLRTLCPSRCRSGWWPFV